MHEERITGSKIDLDLSAGSTYIRVYTVQHTVTHTETVNNSELLGFGMLLLSVCLCVS